MGLTLLASTAPRIGQMTDFAAARHPNCPSADGDPASNGNIVKSVALTGGVKKSQF
jgi:hypothetical protein